MSGCRLRLEPCGCRAGVEESLISPSDMDNGGSISAWGSLCCGGIEPWRLDRMDAGVGTGCSRGGCGPVGVGGVGASGLGLDTGCGAGVGVGVEVGMDFL